MSDVGTISVLVGLIGAIVTAVFAVVRLSFASARNDDQERRITSLRGDLQDAILREQRMEQAIKELTVRVNALEDENRILRSFVPTQDELNEVKRVAQVHYDENSAFMAEWRENTRWFIAAVDRMASDIKTLIVSLRGRNG